MALEDIADCLASSRARRLRHDNALWQDTVHVAVEHSSALYQLPRVPAREVGAPDAALTGHKVAIRFKRLALINVHLEQSCFFCRLRGRELFASNVEQKRWARHLGVERVNRTRRVKTVNLHLWRGLHELGKLLVLAHALSSRKVVDFPV